MAIDIRLTMLGGPIGLTLLPWKARLQMSHTQSTSRIDEITRCQKLRRELEQFTFSEVYARLSNDHRVEIAFAMVIGAFIRAERGQFPSNEPDIIDALDPLRDQTHSF